MKGSNFITMRKWSSIVFWDANRINGELYLSDNFYGKKTIRRINISYPVENRTILKQKVAFKHSFPSLCKLTTGAKCTWQKDSPEVGTTRGPACIVGRSAWRPTAGGLWRPSGNVNSAQWLSVSAKGTASHCSTKTWPKTHRSESILLSNDIQWAKSTNG